LRLQGIGKEKLQTLRQSARLKEIQDRQDRKRKRSHEPEDASICDPSETLNKRRQRTYVCSFCEKILAKSSGKASHERIHYKDPKNFKVARSEIDKDGLFTIIAIPRNTLTLEFFGERVTPDEADIAEAKYLEEGIDSRLFAVDESLVIDGTKEISCMVKFVNHVCGPICEEGIVKTDMWGPNCEAVVIEINGQKRIFIITLRDIAEG
jgi:SET domain-containing protein